MITCATSWTWATVSANAVTLIGAGASFPASVYGEAMSAYAQATANVTVTYNSFGSGSGLCRIQNASVECTDSKGVDEVDFACSDALLNDAAYAAYPDLQMYPVIAGAVALVYNLPDSTYSGTATVLKFDANALLGVFLGNITRWNDAAITALNPTMTLPNELIKIVVRQDSSGTTEAWTSALSTMNASFASGVGTSKLPDWSAVLSSYVTRSQGIGVTSYVKATNYSLGYAVLADANAVNASIAGYVHAGTSTAVLPNSASILQAVKTRGLQFGNNGDNPVRLTATIAPVLTNALAWPFTTYSYVVLRTGMVGFTESDRLRAGASCENVKQTVAFWNWFLTSAQSSRIAEQHGFAAMHDEIGALVSARLIADVYCQGTRVAAVTTSTTVQAIQVGVTAPVTLNRLLYSLRALYEAYNSSSTLAIRELTTAEGALANILADNGMAIGIDLVGTPLAALSRLPLFSIEARMGLNKGVLQLGATGTTLALDSVAVAAILSGDATTWGHPEIVRLNTFLNGVTAPIVLAGILDPEANAFYRTYLSQLVTANASFTLATPSFRGLSYSEVAAFVVETNSSIAFLPGDVVNAFKPYLSSSSALSNLAATQMDVYYKPVNSGAECGGAMRQALKSMLSMLEWMASDTDVQGIITEAGVTPSFASSPAVLQTFLSNVRSVTCNGVSILNPQNAQSSAALSVSPLIMALSVGLGLLTFAMFAFFGGALLKSLFVQTILNQYKRSHPPTDAEVTIVVTDVQASTQLWQKASVHMNRALAIHDKIMRAAIHQTFGYEVLTEGDSFVIAFHSAGDALKFAMLVQERMQNYAWDSPLIRVCNEVYDAYDAEIFEQATQGRNFKAKELLLNAVSSRRVIQEDTMYDEGDVSTHAGRGQMNAFRVPLGAKASPLSEIPKIHGLRVRIGMHTGFCQSRTHPTTRRREYYKGAVTIASAVSDCATGGQTVISGETMAAILGEIKETSRAFHALHMGRHQMGLNAKELDLTEAVDERTVQVDGKVGLDDSSAPTDDVTFALTTDSTRLRWRASDSETSTEEGSLEVNPAYRYAQNAKVSIIKKVAYDKIHQTSLFQSELVQAVPKSLATRLALFSNLRTVRQLEPSYYDSPGLNDMKVTIVFTYIEGLKELSVALKDVMEDSVGLLNAAVRATLPVFNGYESRESNGEFLLAFHSPNDAYKWALLAQSAFMKLDWPKKLLTHRSARRMRNGRRDVFFGLRVGMGVCSGKCADIRPCIRTGRSEYFGAILNFASRVARSAKGGQILTDYETLKSAIQNDYVVEFCHDLGMYQFKGIDNTVRVIQVSDASLMMRSFEEIDAIQVAPPVGLDEDRDLRSQTRSDDRSSVCILLCTAKSPLIKIVQSLVRAIRKEIQVVSAQRIDDVVSQLRHRNSAGLIRNHMVIVSDEIERLDVVDACRQIRRKLNLFMQPRLAVYASLLNDLDAEQLGIDCLLPTLDAPFDASSSRNSYVDGDSDSEYEEDMIAFKQVVESFLLGEASESGLGVLQRLSESGGIASAPTLEANQNDEKLPTFKQAPVPTHNKPLLSMSNIGMLTTTLEAVCARAFAIDVNQQLIFATRRAVKAGVGASSGPLPPSDWLSRVSTVAAKAQRGILRQSWVETIKGSWLDENSEDEYVDAVHKPIRLGDDFAVVLVTLQSR